MTKKVDIKWLFPIARERKIVKAALLHKLNGDDNAYRELINELRELRESERKKTRTR